jgi:hypothetical protein
MYKQAVKTYDEISVFILLIATVSTVVSHLTSSSWIIIFMTMMLAYYAHRNILTGEILTFKKNPDRESNFSWVFIWRFLTVILVPIIIAIALAYKTVGISNIFNFALIVTIVYFTGLGITLSLVGTVLPAASINADASYSAALKRGRPQFWNTLWKLFYGPVVMSILGGFLLNLLYSLAPYLIPIASMKPVIYIIIEIIYVAISFFSTVLVATILSQVFMDSERRETPQSDNLDH